VAVPVSTPARTRIRAPTVVAVVRPRSMSPPTPIEVRRLGGGDPMHPDAGMSGRGTTRRSIPQSRRHVGSVHLLDERDHRLPESHPDRLEIFRLVSDVLRVCSLLVLPPRSRCEITCIVIDGARRDSPAKTRAVIPMCRASARSMLGVTGISSCGYRLVGLVIAHQRPSDAWTSQTSCLADHIASSQPKLNRPGAGTAF
jgi:hypothetical protein